MRLAGVGYGGATCVGFWRWKVKALIRRVPLRVLDGWLNQNLARTSHWIRLIRKEQRMYRALIWKKNIGLSFPLKDPTEMFVNFIYYRMLVDVAIFHGIIKKAVPLTEGTHCLHATKIEEPLMFQISPVHSLSLLFIYLLGSLFIYFRHLCFSCHSRSHWWKVVNTTKTLKGKWIFIITTTSEPDRPVAVTGIVRR